MIHCVAFSVVVRYLSDLGFLQIGAGERFVAFEDARGVRVILRPPNVNGHIPEILVNDAFDVAGIGPPEWPVFWCD